MTSTDITHLATIFPPEPTGNPLTNQNEGTRSGHNGDVNNEDKEDDDNNDDEDDEN